MIEMLFTWSNMSAHQSWGELRTRPAAASRASALTAVRRSSPLPLAAAISAGVVAPHQQRSRVPFEIKVRAA
jgi:hypothetical protein